MTPKDIRTAVAAQCGFNKTQQQRLLESIIPNDSLEKEPVANNATTETGYGFECVRCGSHDHAKCELPAYRVYYEDGSSYVTSMAADVTLEMARKYFVGIWLTQPDESSMRVIDVQHEPEPIETLIEDFKKATSPILLNKAVQVCNAGDWPDHLPESFEDWLRSSNDAIETTMPLDRTEATAQWFDNKAKTERSPFV